MWVSSFIYSVPYRKKKLFMQLLFQGNCLPRNIFIEYPHKINIKKKAPNV